MSDAKRGVPSKAVMRGLRWIHSHAGADYEACAHERGTGQFDGTRGGRPMDSMKLGEGDETKLREEALLLPGLREALKWKPNTPQLENAMTYAWEAALKSFISAIERSGFAPSPTRHNTANPERRSSLELSELKPDGNEGRSREVDREGGGSAATARGDAVGASRAECGPRASGGEANREGLTRVESRDAAPQVPPGVCPADDPNPEARRDPAGSTASPYKATAPAAVASSERGEAVSVSDDRPGTGTPAEAAPSSTNAAPQGSSGRQRPDEGARPADAASSGDERVDDMQHALELDRQAARSSTRRRLEELYGLVRDGLGNTFPSIDDMSRDCLLGYLDELYAATFAPSASGAPSPLRNFIARQEELDPEARDILYRNLWDLYESAQPEEKHG
jgi:hypothetical protein